MKKELLPISIALLPFIYLAYVWGRLPEKVPMHWNIRGEVDRYGERPELFFLVAMPLFIYLILLVVPKIDPKNKLNKMGNKYQSIKVLMTSFLSILTLYIIYSSLNASFANPNFIMLLIGALYVFLGNYFKTIKANYFVGIRTPWTLENETVWKETHKLGGKMWFAGGFIIILSSLILHKLANFIFFLSVTAVITIVPVVFSYLKFRKLEKE